jgi:hypothetical protein
VSTRDFGNEIVRLPLNDGGLAYFYALILEQLPVSMSSAPGGGWELASSPGGN